MLARYKEVSEKADIYASCRKLSSVDSSFRQFFLATYQVFITFNFQYLSRARIGWDVNTIWHIAHHMLHFVATLEFVKSDESQQTARRLGQVALLETVRNLIPWTTKLFDVGAAGQELPPLRLMLLLLISSNVIR